ncbi:Uncharacterised protein [Nocardiopsis dassonvillei]|uniref:Uncharacterized protein n=1 Tax=Nocardiopsis dassonvillei (strain ATCC 23218 / DSM 43111 / CIP 107115 / JCM 7437 / KCTC 9190 / NBRC 14626 / NCTC 10488 / NRRL B-5397 / IMRU 509) TaxID=446468 RepID=D7AY82_NOCDD|nr:hypothetical protein Ndas_4573 [Nocardiopsis dassonvillei subsp. dassonvillei DSM 43111]VEI90473.1 Uncharacterised protein [Nocardiopsis dassonvillei]
MHFTNKFNRLVNLDKDFPRHVARNITREIGSTFQSEIIRFSTHQPRMVEMTVKRRVVRVRIEFKA